MADIDTFSEQLVDMAERFADMTDAAQDAVIGKEGLAPAGSSFGRGRRQLPARRRAVLSGVRQRTSPSRQRTGATELPDDLMGAFTRRPASQTTSSGTGPTAARPRGRLGGHGRRPSQDTGHLGSLDRELTHSAFTPGPGFSTGLGFRREGVLRGPRARVRRLGLRHGALRRARTIRLARRAREIERAVAAMPPARTIDIACGTGWLTQHLPGEITGLDASPSMLEVAAARVPEAEFLVGRRAGAAVRGRVVRPDRRPVTSTDTSRRRIGNGSSPRRAVSRGELVVIDSALHDGVEPVEQQERVLKDGSRWEVYKRYFVAAELAEELGDGDVLFDGNWFVVVRSRG